MKARMSIKNIILVMAIISLASMFFINISFATNTGKITTETARLREQPQTDSKVLELASLGEEVEIIESIDGWYKVKYKRITGYIRSDLIEVKNKEEINTSINNTEEGIITENTQIEENKPIEDNINEANTTPVQENSIVEKGKYKISENVKLKIIPLISAIELNEVNKDVEVEVIEILNDWAKVKTSEGKEGWLRIEKLSQLQTTNTQNNQEQKPEVAESSSQVTTKTMYVNSQTINVRQQANRTSQVIKQLKLNTQVTVLSSDNGWAYVNVDGTKGYILENLLSNTKQETTRSTITQRTTTNASNNNTSKNITNKNAENTPITPTESTSTSSTGASVASYAKQFLGCKYVYGGTTTKGFDCSGFTQYVYKHFGVTLNRTAATQYSNGTKVTSLQAGDLVMFGKSGISHVGIYIGGNTFIHAANSNKGVTIDSLSSEYYKTNYVGARRIL